MSAENDLPQRQFEPLPKQKQFLHSTAGQVLLSGSFGAGKSRIGCEKGYMMNMMYPGNRGLIVRKHFSDVRASTIQQTLLEEVIPESHIPEDGHNKGNHEIQHRTGVTDDDGEPILSQIHYHGLDSGKSTSDDDLPRKIGSHAYGWIFVDEGTELSRGEWSQLQGRLRYKGKRQLGKFYEVPFRQIFTATNPASPQHWMYQMFFEEGKGEVVKMNVEDNPHVPEEYIKRMRRNLSGMYYERYFKGKWIGAEGAIYSEYDPNTHILQPDQIPRGWVIEQRRTFDEEESIWYSPPPDWQVYRTIDLGYRNPFVCQWWARSPDDQLYMFRELYETELLVEDAADRINEQTDEEWYLENTFTDHDAEGVETLRKAGVYAANAKKDVSPGIQAVKGRLRTDDRGEPGIYFLANARTHAPDARLKLDDKPTRTTDELPGYVWKDDDQKDEPKKENDHGADAMRYLVFSVDEGNTMSKEEMEEWADIANNAF